MLAARSSVPAQRVAGKATKAAADESAGRLAMGKSSSLGQPWAADQTLGQNRLYHYTNFAMLGLVPLAFAAHPSQLSLPLDLVLSVAIPVHAHIGVNWIITDYVSTSPSSPARFALMAATVLATLGLLKVTVSGPGVIGSVKELWTGAEMQKREKAGKH